MRLKKKSKREWTGREEKGGDRKERVISELFAVSCSAVKKDGEEGSVGKKKT